MEGGGGASGLFGFARVSSVQDALTGIASSGNKMLEERKGVMSHLSE